MKASATTKGHDHADDSPRPGQYDVGDEPDGGPKTPKNPGAAAPNVRVTVPVSVEVRLVNANLLQEYEIWTWLGTAKPIGRRRLLGGFARTGDGLVHSGHWGIRDGAGSVRGNGHMAQMDDDENDDQDGRVWGGGH